MKQAELLLSSASLSVLIKEVLARHASFRFMAIGFSMSPFILNEDVITLSASSRQQIRLGEIVAFTRTCQKSLAIHRVVGIRKNLYLIKGDNVPCFDGLFPKENILGVVTAIERKNKQVHLSLGRERIIIALLSRYRLIPFLSRTWFILGLHKLHLGRLFERIHYLKNS